MGKLVFCYWDLRGIGAPAINMLEYAGIDYEHKLMTSVEKWFDEKFTLELDFPNLPYVIDGDLRITESWAIYKYIGKKAGLMPSGGEHDKILIDILEGVIKDYYFRLSTYLYNPIYFSLMMTRYLEDLKEQYLDVMERYLTSRKFLIGDKLTYLDFALYETLDQHRLFFTDILSAYPNIDAYMKRFESLDRIKSFFQSDRYHQFPIFGPTSMWGGKKYNDKN